MYRLIVWSTNITIFLVHSVAAADDDDGNDDEHIPTHTYAVVRRLTTFLLGTLFQAQNCIGSFGSTRHRATDKVFLHAVVAGSAAVYNYLGLLGSQFFAIHKSW